MAVARTAGFDRYSPAPGAGSLKFGHATASLLVGKLSASSQQNALAAALKEYRALRPTIYAAVPVRPAVPAQDPGSSTKESRCTR